MIASVIGKRIVIFREWGNVFGECTYRKTWRKFWKGIVRYCETRALFE